ncbi:MAG: ABC-type transport auxiliary lipoprotein family protein, partial [Alphaproteobacteria bacterium]
PDAPLPENNGTPPILSVSAGSGQTMGQAARDALGRLNKILDDNSAPLHNAIVNFSSFSDVLANNNKKFENILGGLERMTGGPAPKNFGQPYDLTAPRKIKGVPKALQGLLVVSDPTALIALDTQNVAVRTEGKQPPTLRWADNLPKLIQARVVQTFENAGFLGTVNRPTDVATGDFQLQLDIRDFKIELGETSKINIEISTRILDSEGKILAGRVFKTTQSVKSSEVEKAMAAIDEAFGKLDTELVVWASNVLDKAKAPAPEPEPEPEAAPEPQPEPEAAPKPAAKPEAEAGSEPAPASDQAEEPAQTPPSP